MDFDEAQGNNILSNQSDQIVQTTLAPTTPFVAPAIVCPPWMWHVNPQITQQFSPQISLSFSYHQSGAQRFLMTPPIVRQTPLTSPLPLGTTSWPNTSLDGTWHDPAQWA